MNTDKGRLRLVALFLTLTIILPDRYTLLSVRPIDFFCVFYWLKKPRIPRENSLMRLLVIFVSLSLLGLISTVLQFKHEGVAVSLHVFSNIWTYTRYWFIAFFANDIAKKLNSFNDVAKIFVWTLFIVNMIHQTMIMDNSYLADILINWYDIQDTDEAISNIHNRRVGILANPNSSASLLVALSVFSMRSMLSSSNISLILRLCAILNVLVVFTHVVYVFGSRTAAVSLLIVFLLSVLVNSKIQLLILVSLGYLVFNILGDFEFSGSGRVSDFVLETASTSIWTLLNSSRSWFWQESVDIYYNHSHSLSFFIGLGFTKLFRDYADNGLISMFMTSGIIGLYFYVRYLSMLIAKLKFTNIRGYYSTLCIAVIAFLVYDLTADIFHNLQMSILLIFLSGMMFHYLPTNGNLRKKKLF